MVLNWGKQNNVIDYLKHKYCWSCMLFCSLRPSLPPPKKIYILGFIHFWEKLLFIFLYLLSLESRIDQLETRIKKTNKCFFLKMCLRTKVFLLFEHAYLWQYTTTALCCNAPYKIALHFIALHFINDNIIHRITLHFTHCTALNCTVLRCKWTNLPCNTNKSSALHCIILQCNTKHCTALHLFSRH